jgi:hypothetical protein
MQDTNQWELSPFQKIDENVLNELSALKEEGYLKTGQDIDDELLDEVINSREL